MRKESIENQNQTGDLKMKNPAELSRVSPADFDLRKLNPRSTMGAGKRADTEARTEENLRKISDLQYRLYAENKQALLVVLQGIDAAGKDGAIRKVFSVLNPQGTRVRSFKVPTERERSHDFLWRIHKNVPRHGEVGIFNRSHYEDVLVVRVKNLAPEPVWRARYEQINQFESLLHASGTRVLKFFLYIDADEQKARFQSRLDDPEKQWKFSKADLEERKNWDAYIEAFQDALTHCSTETAPWHVVPGNRKWVRNWVVSEITRKTLEDMNPQIPPAEKGIAKLKIV